MLTAAASGDLSALYIVGEDPVVSYPDRNKVEKALEDVPFLVVQDIFLSATAQQADVVLPAGSFAEKDGTFTNAERRIQRVRHGITSPGEAKTDYAIIDALLSRLGQKVVYTGPAAVFAELSSNVEGYHGILFEEIGQQGVVWGGETLALGAKKVVPVEGAAAVDSPLQLVTGSALYHSGTVSTRAKGPQAVVAEPYIELSLEDAAALKVSEGEMLVVKGNGATLKLKAKVDRRLPRGVVFAPYHFAEAGLNRLYKGEAAIAVELSK
jgi:predicted molibdopterin-dependent oxidoreductase YjgC